MSSASGPARRSRSGSALLIRAPAGNILWDSTSYLDDEGHRHGDQAGGISMIAVSHRHFYGSMIEWAHAFRATDYIHAADRRWAARPHDAVRFWDGDTCQIADGLTRQLATTPPR
jgi:hypothetical protein